MLLPNLQEGYVTRIITESFSGYNHHLRIAANEMYDMQNLSGDEYPLLATRKKRGTVTTLLSPRGMHAKDALIYIDGGTVYYNGLAVSGLTLSGDGVRQIVSMGAYAVIFPDGKYFNTQDLTELGSIDNEVTTAGETTFTLCKRDGSTYTDYSVSATAPADPQDGALWLDTSTTPNTLKQYSDGSSMWVQVVSTYVRVAAGGISAGFEKGDGIELSGTGRDDLSGSFVLEDVGDGYFVIPGIVETVYMQTTPVTVSRRAPDMDFVCESNNRLWGCKYGMVDGEPINELYCCKLGDFKNWRCYQGLSTDSWAASVGSDGVFTGAINYLGYPTFFKENHIHRIAVSSSGGHQVSDTPASGVQKGSAASLAMVGETLYYKGRTGIFAYGGSSPVSVGDKLGETLYYSASGGGIGGKYYLSMQDASEAWHLFVLDTARGMWHREDDLHAVCFTRCDDDLYCFDAETGDLLALMGTDGTWEGTLSWVAESGVLHYEYPDRKYVSRYDIRMKLPPGSTMNFFIEYDSSGEWLPSGTVHGTGLNTFVIPVRPRRCDHLRLRMVGSGEFRLFSIVRNLEQGSDA